MNDILLVFLKDECKNYNGYTLSDIWEFNDIQLEKQHNYIQWIFPLEKRSSFNIFCPIVRNISLYDDLIIRNNMIKSFSMMLKFYGFILKDNKILKHNYEARKVIWISKNNHNFLRITRILKSLSLFKLNYYAIEFYKVLLLVYEENKDIISEKTIQYWTEAIK